MSTVTSPARSSKNESKRRLPLAPQSPVKSKKVALTQHADHLTPAVAALIQEAISSASEAQEVLQELENSGQSDQVRHTMGTLTQVKHLLRAELSQKDAVNSQSPTSSKADFPKTVEEPMVIDAGPSKGRYRFLCV